MHRLCGRALAADTLYRSHRILYANASATANAAGTSATPSNLTQLDESSATRSGAVPPSGRNAASMPSASAPTASATKRPSWTRLSGAGPPRFTLRNTGGWSARARAW